jgi:hypothetical protein
MQGLQAKEGVMDDTALKELRNDLRHMDGPELLAFGRKHRANPDSVEYQEAQAAWHRKQEKRRARELENRQTCLPVESAWDTERIAFFNSHKDVFPWVCHAIVKKGHFDVLKLHHQPNIPAKRN